MNAPNRTPDWLLERIALGELSPDELARAKAKLLAEPDGAERMAALERSNQEILAAHAPAEVTAEVKRRAHLNAALERAHAPARRSWLPIAMGVPVAAALAVFFVVSQPDTQPSNNHSGLPLANADRLKGQTTTIEIRRQRGTDSEWLQPGASAKAGDVLQLAYLRAGAPYGVIVSFDGGGTVTRHLPESGEQAAKLVGSGSTELPHAYELDAAPGFERFFFITSESPFEVSEVLAAARKLAVDPARARTAELDLRGSLAQTSFLLEKSP